MSNYIQKLKEYEINELASKRQRLIEAAFWESQINTINKHNDIKKTNDYEKVNNDEPINENYYWDDDQNEYFDEPINENYYWDDNQNENNVEEELFIPENINPLKYKYISNICKFDIFCLKQFPEDNEISSKILSDIESLISRIFWYEFPRDEELNTHDYTNKTVGYVLRAINRISKVNNLTNKVQAEILNLANCTIYLP
jgi:hypothetical protein